MPPPPTPELVEPPCPVVVELVVVVVAPPLPPLLSVEVVLLLLVPDELLLVLGSSSESLPQPIASAMVKLAARRTVEMRMCSPLEKVSLSSRYVAPADCASGGTMTLRRAAWLGLMLAGMASLAACGDAAVNETSLTQATPPTAPNSNDPAFVVTSSRKWLLVGNGLTQGHDALSITVTAPEGVQKVSAWLGKEQAAATRDGNSFTAQLDVSTIEPGTHQVLLAADGAAVAFAALQFVRTHPLYVIVTIDWDRPDTADGELSWSEKLHELFAELRLTQLVGPYTFTESVAPERVAKLMSWLTSMRDQHGDEIGLHIHPYCSFVQAAGVTCNTEPSLTKDTADSTGYTVACSTYSESDFSKLLVKADELFVANGLGKPTSFRAGAWTANDAVLKALAANGYVADTSANNYQRIEEWTTPEVELIWDWNKENWSEIGDTSQPYYPSVANVQQPGEPSIGILEVPDNGSLVDYVQADEMIGIFSANWPGGALMQPTQLSIGYHNSTLWQYRNRFEEALTHINGFLASQDTGPVVFITLSETAQVWPKP